MKNITLTVIQPALYYAYFFSKHIILKRKKADNFTANLKRDAQLWNKDVEMTESDIVVKLNAHEEKLSAYISNDDLQIFNFVVLRQSNGCFLAIFIK